VKSEHEQFISKHLLRRRQAEVEGPEANSKGLQELQCHVPFLQAKSQATKRSINLFLYTTDLNRLGIDELEKVMKKLQKV